MIEGRHCGGDLGARSTSRKVGSAIDWSQIAGLARKSALRSRLVLTVRDEPLVREVAGVAISEAGCEVIEAADADKAHQNLIRNDVGVLCTGIDRLRSLNGLKLAGIVQERAGDARCRDIRPRTITRS